MSPVGARVHSQTVGRCAPCTAGHHSEERTVSRYCVCSRCSREPRSLRWMEASWPPSAVLSWVDQGTGHSTVTKVRARPEAGEPGGRCHHWKGPLLRYLGPTFAKLPGQGSWSPPKADLILFLIGMGCWLPELCWLCAGAHF